MYFVHVDHLRTNQILPVVNYAIKYKNNLIYSYESYL